MAERPNLEAALYHARAGRPVFPCSPRDKRPAVPKAAGGRGFKDATTDEDVIRAWWGEYPDAVPGMPTGARVGVWVLDVDTKPGKAGDETLSSLLATFGPLPDTVETITATGGRHLYFRHPRDGRTIPNAASQLGTGAETWGEGGYPEVPFARTPGGRLRVPDLDVRGDGGYVILPGAVMADGRRYEWEGSSDPDEGARVAEAPAWLLALVCQDPSAAPAPGVAGDAEPIGEGGRNDHIYRLGCSLRAKGLAESVIVAALLAENAERCRPPLPTAEVVATARSAASKPPGLSPEYERRRRDAAGRRAAHDAGDPPAPGPGERGSASGKGAGRGGVHPGTTAPLPAAGDASPPGDDGPPPAWDEGGGDSPPKPIVRIVSGRLPYAADTVEQVLAQGGAPLYVHGTRLVRVGEWTQTKGPITRPTGAGLLIDATPAWMVDHCTRRIRFQRFDKRVDDWVDIDCPTKVAATVLDRVGSWKFPALTGFCDAPTLDLSGRVVSAPGYDAESGLYLSRPPAIEPIPEDLDRYAAEAAADVLAEAVSTFPFVTPADQAACLAGVMTALFRRVLPSAPIIGVSASTPATGKSKLVDVISTIATGRPASVMAMGYTGEELEKRLHAMLLSGDAICSIDNVSRAVNSDVLCQIATQTSTKIRVLGLSKTAEVPTNSTICMTGNNLTLVGDLVRRVVVINLDAGVERPELRSFDRDAIAYVLHHRAKLIRAALTIARAYIAAGAPPVDLAPFGSFETWDRFVRQPLVWCGWPDPLTPAEAMRGQDHELTGARDLITAWRQCLEDKPVTAAELHRMCNAMIPQFSGGALPEHPELAAAAEQLMGDSGKWSARDLGYRLRSLRGRIFGGLRIAEAGSSRSGNLWRVEELA